MNVGFIGAGTITEAVVTGLLEAGATELSIFLSPRNRERSRALGKRYAAVEVATDNQQVVDRSELVFLAVRPQVAGAVLAALEFRPGQRVASLIATLSAASAARQVRPAKFAGRVAPLPSAAWRSGPVAIFPPDKQLAGLLEATGTVIQVSEEAHIDALFSVSAMMAPYFELLEAVSCWLRDQGIDSTAADVYTGSLFRAIAEQSTQPTGEGFAALVRQHTTLGGINEQMRRELLSAGFYDRVKAGLDLIQARMQGRAKLEDTLVSGGFFPRKTAASPRMG